MKLSPLALACTLATLWGATMLLMTWWIILFDGSMTEPTMLGRLYRGYAITPLGSVIGLAWGALDGFLGGLIIAWVYNFFARRLPASRAAGTSAP
jgi:hypothetical protein